jgi:1,4-alpha-glucan branching enzyme
MITKVPGNNGKIRVTFSLPASIWADTIHLVGDFNHWNTSATPLRLDESKWSVSLELDIGCVYQYRYLLNHSEWNNDWNADALITSEQGNENSVVNTQM